MKVLPFKIPKPNDDAIIYQEDYVFTFYNKLHQHEEIQLSYIAEGSGTLLIGDSIKPYSSGDIVVIGSNLPHVFKSEKSTTRSRMLTLFFTINAFGEHFFNLEEMRPIAPFFTRAINGFKISTHQLDSIFYSLKTKNKFEQFLALMLVLQELSKLEFESLSSYIYEKRYSDNEGKRMSAIIEFTMNNFKKGIRLEEVAHIANMTKNAFCKYFKRRTNKSYFSFLNELRIEHACKMLKTDKELSIVAIAELSGFNNISNFNRHFKKFKNSTPFNYRNSI